MAANRTRTAPTPPPPGADDLAQIDGLAPKDADQLYKRGITTFGHLGSLTTEEIAAQLDGPAAKHIARIHAKRWIEQARALAEQRTDQLVVDPSDGSLESPGHNGQLAAEPQSDQAPRPKGESPIIVVTLTLNPDASIGETRVNYPVLERSFKHVSWPGWDEKRLLHLLGRHARLTDPASKHEASATNSMPAHEESSASRDVLTPAQAALEALTAMSRPDPRPAPRLRRLALVREASGEQKRLAKTQDRFRVQLDLDVTDLVTAGTWARHYDVTVFGKPMGGGPRRRIAQSRGPIPVEAEPLLSTYGSVLPRGLYRLEADLVLDAGPGEKPYHETFTLRGDLVYVY